jgi:hypothetical protein
MRVNEIAWRPSQHYQKTYNKDTCTEVCQAYPRPGTFGRSVHVLCNNLFLKIKGVRPIVIGLCLSIFTELLGLHEVLYLTKWVGSLEAFHQRSTVPLEEPLENWEWLEDEHDGGSDEDPAGHRLRQRTHSYVV